MRREVHALGRLGRLYGPGPVYIQLSRVYSVQGSQEDDDDDDDVLVQAIFTWLLGNNARKGKKVLPSPSPLPQAFLRSTRI